MTAASAVLLLLGAQAEALVARPGPGEPAPAFEAAATSGGSLSLASYKGKRTVVLAFFPKAFTAG
jgi:peroxiredoxin Q/BCP